MKRSTKAAVAVAAMLMSGTAMAETIYVSPGQNIQDAVDKANPGDAIIIEGGVYPVKPAASLGASGYDGGLSETPVSAGGGDVCSSGAMSMIAGAANTIISMIGGGRATAKGQQIQLVELIRANLCAGEQNDKLAISNEHERKNIAHGTVNSIPGINGMIERTEGSLHRGGFTTPEEDILGDYEQQYPDAFDPDDRAAAESADIEWSRRSRNSDINSVGIQNRSIQEQRAAVRRARDHASAGRSGPGLRAEVQAQNAIGAETVASIQNLTAAVVGDNRAVSHMRLQNELRKQMANATSFGFMSSLGTCSSCTISKPFIGN